MADVTTETVGEVSKQSSTSTNQQEQAEDLISPEASTSYDNLDENDTSDDLYQKIEDAMRDVCTLRKTIPSKVAELVEERFASRKIDYAHTSASKSEDHSRQLELDGMENICCQSENISNLNSLSDDLVKIREEYSCFVRLKEIQKGMDLKETRDILFSEKRKRKREDSSAEGKKLSLRITRLDPKKIPSEMTPVKGQIKKSNKSQSASKIPKRKNPVTPSTPLSTRSSAKKQKYRLKALGKT